MPEVLKTLFITEFAIYNAQIVNRQLTFIENMLGKIIQKNAASRIRMWEQDPGNEKLFKMALLSESISNSWGKTAQYMRGSVVPTGLAILGAMQGMALYAKELPIAFKHAMITGNTVAHSLSKAFQYGAAGVNLSTTTSAIQAFNKKLFTDKNLEQVLITQLGMSAYHLRSQGGEQAYNTVMSKLMAIGDVSRRNAIATKIFGESWADVLYAQERISQLNLTDKFQNINYANVQRLEQSFTKMKASVMEMFLIFADKLGPTLAVIFDAVSGILRVIAQHIPYILMISGALSFFLGKSPIHKGMGLSMFVLGISSLFTSATTEQNGILYKQNEHLSNIEENTSMLADHITDIVIASGAGAPPIFQRDILVSLAGNIGG